MHQTLKERVQQSCRHKKLSLRWLSRELGITAPVLGQALEQGRAGYKRLPEIATILGVELMWLQTGQADLAPRWWKSEYPDDLGISSKVSPLVQVSNEATKTMDFDAASVRQRRPLLRQRMTLALNMAGNVGQIDQQTWGTWNDDADLVAPSWAEPLLVVYLVDASGGKTWPTGTALILAPALNPGDWPINGDPVIVRTYRGQTFAGWWHVPLDQARFIIFAVADHRVMWEGSLGSITHLRRIAGVIPPAPSHVLKISTEVPNG